MKATAIDLAYRERRLCDEMRIDATRCSIQRKKESKKDLKKAEPAGGKGSCQVKAEREKVKHDDMAGRKQEAKEERSGNG